MIRKPNEIQDGAKKIRILVAGYPGIGKSTLALSAPNPLHIDVDFGIDRIEPRYRKDYIQPASYDEPATVFLGEMLGQSLRLPNSFPVYIAIASLTQGATNTRR